MSETKDKIKFSNFWQTSFWTFKLGFKISARWYGMMVFTKVMSEVLPLLTTFFSSLVLGELVASLARGDKFLDQNLILYIVLLFLSNSFERINGLADEYIWMRFNYKIDLTMFPIYLEQLGKIDIQYHEDPDFKTKLKKVDEALGWKLISSFQSIASIIATTIGTIFITYIFFQINIIFIFIILIPIILDYLINVKFGKNLWSIWETNGDEKKETSHALSGLSEKGIIHEAKIYNFASYIAHKFFVANERFITNAVSTTNKKYLALSGNTIFGLLTIGLLQVYLIYQTVSGFINIQGYSFYIQNVFDVSRRFNRFADSLSRVYGDNLFIQELKEFLELPDKIIKPKNGIVVDQSSPSIEFKNVSFKYPTSENYILQNLSFKIDAGEKIALVGENGAGKSTIIKLLARFYDVTEGEILINGIDIKQLDLTAYYKLWGVLFQYFARYWFTLRENIGIGNIEDIKNSELIKAAGDKAGLDTILPKLPHGYENMMSTDFTDGKDLSGGEWQKVGIARGMFANPKFIVLDEPTSALDALAEAKVFQEIEKMASDTTMLIVSHRFATVRNADKIIVLEDGKISEQGSHEKLMTENGLYAKMFLTQAEGYK